MSMNNASESRTPIAALLVLAGCTLTASLGISIASVMLPMLTQRFSAMVFEVQWVMLAYLLTLTLATVPAGRLADLYGHRPLLITGLLMFLAGSFVCAAAPTLTFFVTGRTLQGLGGAVLIALPMAIARHALPSSRLGSAMGLLGTSSAVGTAMGPSLGGALLAWADWRMAFYLLAGVTALILSVAARVIQHDDPKSDVTLADLDIPGTLVLILALTSYAMATHGAATELPLPVGALLVIALVILLLFVIVETHAKVPLVPMTLLLDHRTGPGLLMNLIIGTVMMATLVVGPFFLMFALGLNNALMGLVLSVGPFVAALSGVPAGRLTDRFGANRALLTGLVQTMVGLLCLATLPRLLGVSGYVLALVALTPAFQLFLAANNTAMLSHSKAEHRGQLAGLLGLSRNLGLMTGASAMPLVFVVMLGTEDIASATIADVTQAFSLTFTVAAALVFVATCLVYRCLVQGPVHHQQDEQV